MPKKPANPAEPVQYITPADIAYEADRGQQIKDNPASLSLPQWGQPDPTDRDRLMSAFLSLGQAQQGANQGAQTGDPLAAVLGSFAGAAGGYARNTPEAIAAARQEQQRQAALAHFESMPVEAVSPDLIRSHPELKGIPLKYVNQISPLIARDASFRDQHYNLDQAASLIAQGQKPEDAAKTKADLQKLYPTGMVPKDLVHVAAQNARLGVTVGEKDSQLQLKRLTAMGDALDPNKARAGTMGTSKAVFDRAERLQSLASAYKDGNLDSRQVEELAIGLNAMLSGANGGAASQVAALVPKTIAGDIQKTKEWLLNQPQGTNQQAFVQRMLSSIEREKATAQDQIKRTQMQRVARYADLEKSNPDEFYNILQSAGIEPAEYAAFKKGGYKPMSSVQAPEGGAGNDLQSAAMAELKRRGL